MKKMLTSYQLNKLTLKNRIVMPPMCMYSAKDGYANDFHSTHYETRAIGGVGLIIVEASAVMENGRISDEDLGIWDDSHIDPLKIVTEKVKAHDCRIGIQLAHSGRKGVGELWPVAPSALAFDEESRVPHELSIEAIQEVVEAFGKGARRAVEAGFEFIEIHGAHGYLLNEFLSPITNERTDKYGGSLENRVRILKEVINKVRENIPKEMPLGLRISAEEYHEEGIHIDEMVDIIHQVKDSLDIVHVSSGGVISVPMKVYPGYQLQFSERIKKECGIDTIAVGLIHSRDMIEESLQNNRCDLVALGRLLLREPYYTLHAYKEDDQMEKIPKAYYRGF